MRPHTDARKGLKRRGPMVHVRNARERAEIRARLSCVAQCHLYEGDRARVGCYRLRHARATEV